MDLVQAEREGRIIILYHSIAMAVIAIEVYMITAMLKMKEFYKKAVRAPDHGGLPVCDDLRHGVCLLRTHLAIPWTCTLLG